MHTPLVNHLRSDRAEMRMINEEESLVRLTPSRIFSNISIMIHAISKINYASGSSSSCNANTLKHAS